MAFIDTIPPEEAQDAVLEMYQRQQGSWGYVPDYAKVFCYRPEAMVRWAKLLAEVRRPLDARRFELVTFAAAHELRNSSCSLAHGQKLSEFIGDEDVMRIAAGEAVDSVSEAEQEMVRFSRKVARDASTITAEDVEALKRHGLSDADVFDIAATVAARSFFTKLLDALGSVPDSSFASMNERLRDALTLARPIDTTPVEVMPAPE
jgi:uncharacterized peroxidase-related enzyme